MPEFDPLPLSLEEAISEYKLWINENLKNTQNSHKIIQPLYHYTDAEGLKGIIDNGSMWFTDVRNLNDPSEFRFGLSLVSKELENYENKSNNNLINEFIKFSQNNITKLSYNNLFCYISCFSELRDDLNQWRCYRDGGQGYCIGFSDKFFEIENLDGACPNKLNEDFLYSYVLPVIYDGKKSIDHYNLFIDKAIVIINKILNDSDKFYNNKEILNQFGRRIHSLIISSTIWYAIITKHPAYEAEKEVRKFIIETEESIRKHIKTRTRGGEIIPYISVNQPVHQEKMITEIIVGPAADQRAVDAVKALLQSKNMSWVDVTKSKIPFRSAYQPINSLEELGPFESQ